MFDEGDIADNVAEVVREVQIVGAPTRNVVQVVLLDLKLMQTECKGVKEDVLQQLNGQFYDYPEPVVVDEILEENLAVLDREEQKVRQVTVPEDVDVAPVLVVCLGA